MSHIPQDISSTPAVTSARVRWSALPTDARKTQWSMTNASAGLLCLPVIAAWTFYGIISGKHEWAVLAVAGAVAVGFGVFQRLASHHLRPMVITMVGIGAATWIGSVAQHCGWIYLIIAASIGGYIFGAMTGLGYAAWWIGLQWIIALLVYGSRPSGVATASFNALCVIVGGGSQLIFLAIFRPWTQAWFRTQSQPPLNADRPILEAFEESAKPGTITGRHALRVALAMVIATLINHFWGLPNGYWTPMTAAILLKPDLHETLVRGVNRLIGTIAGVSICTLIIAWHRPYPPELGVLLLLAIWGCFALQRVNYAIFATCLTAYVVFLLATLGLPEPIVALHRLEATLAGAGVALVAHLIPLRAARTLAVSTE